MLQGRVWYGYLYLYAELPYGHCRVPFTQTDEPITVIAGKVGYTNTSKFSEAFKKVKGKTPLEYRKVKI